MASIVKNKSAQTGEAITWMVATFVIIVILGISIYAASAIGSKNKLNKLAGGSFLKAADTLASKSLFAYVLTKDNNKLIYQEFKEQGLNEFRGELAQNIFKDFYKDEYSKVWLGFLAVEQKLSIDNNYFGKRTAGPKEEFEISGGISESIKVDDDINLNLLLCRSDFKC